ncbi:hypothetical protein [Tautonia marina]|uniref:hypothetical protein n=1 Tax=Tautonia marina TaxID=2653855 RepID=UPI001260511A|nr:hypothetical protein [Tautonia marina]
MDPTTSFDPHDQTHGEAYLDTVALLQEEIERLEAELHAVTDASANSNPELSDSQRDTETNQRIEELTHLLEERDETITLLWEHLSAIEESQAARSAEWEQLHHWVEELEHRLSESDDLHTQPGSNGQMAGSLRDELEAHRQGWDQERQELEAELARVRLRLQDATNAAGDSALNDLQQENHRLRDECRRLSAFEAEATRLNDRVTLLQAQLESTREELHTCRNEFQSERLRHQAELTELRTGRAVPSVSAADLTPSERVRALREHLSEVHAREEEERKERQLSNRISRLLGRIGSHH